MDISSCSFCAKCLLANVVMLLHLHGFVEALPNTELFPPILVVFVNYFQYFSYC